MKNYLDLIPISAKVHKRQNRMTLICIVLAVFLVTAIFSMADMELRSQKIRAVKDYGNWHITLKNVSEADAQLIASRPEVAASSWYDTLNYRLKDGYYIEGKNTVICGVEKPLMTDIMPDTIVEGEYPAAENQIILTQNAKSLLNVGLGDKISLKTPSNSLMEFTISGFGMDSAMVMKSDAIGVFMPVQGFKNIYMQSEHKELQDIDMIYYVQFSNHVNIRKAIQDIKTQYGFAEENIAQNTALLGVMGQSNDSYMLGLYLAAGVLFLLVLTAGILMIASSLNSNITQRTQFFGMLRCIGADKRQIMRFVRLEALNWCKTAIPAGILLGIIIVWGLCAVLRGLSANYFSQMPVFGVSIVGILCGILTGLLTVLLAAQSPAKKAAGSSPLAAVSVSAGTLYNIRKSAAAKLCKIDTALGIHRAKMNKKNFILMIGSFALSIILFLSFSVVIDFMHHAINPLKPYTPDLSIISSDNTRSIRKDLVKELTGKSGVKRVYGRSFQYNMPAKLGLNDGRINLISYESYQFNWADEENYILEGDLSKVLTDKNFVLTVYDPESPLKVGDQIQLGENEVTVAGILSTCPFDSEPGTETVICSEETFMRLTGESDYTILDIQLWGNATDADVNEIRSLAGGNITFSDRRLSNKEATGAYWSFALFVYGFLAVIAMITVFNIINSISMSVSARTKQYGIMKAIGMDNKQLIKMIAAEAVTYAIGGCIAGCAVGLPVHKFLFDYLITQHWGDPWKLPFAALAIIVILVILSSFAAVYQPSKRMLKLSVIDTINAQ